MSLRKSDSNWWRYQALENEGQRKLRRAMAARPKSAQEQADEILARPGAVSSTGILNPRVVSRDEARVVAQARAEAEQAAGPKPQFGVVSPGELAGRVIGRPLEVVARPFQVAGAVTGAVVPPVVEKVISKRLGKALGARQRGGEVASLFGQAVTGKISPRELGGRLIEVEEKKPLLQQVVSELPAALIPPVGGAKAAVSVTRAGARAATRATAKGLVRIPQRRVQEAGLRLVGARGVAGGAIRLEPHERGARITRFVDKDLQAKFKATNKAVEDLGMKMDALAGTREDEFFVGIDVPKGGRVLPYGRGTEPIPGVTPEIGIKIVDQGLSGKRLFFKSFDDVDQFLKTGEYKAPSITSSLRPGPIKPLYVTEKARVAEPLPAPQARFFDSAIEERKEAMLRQVDVDPESVKVSTSAGFGRTAKTFRSIPAFTDLPQDAQAKLARLAFGGVPSEAGVSVPTAALKQEARLQARTPAPPTKPVATVAKRQQVVRGRMPVNRQEGPIAGEIPPSAAETGAVRYDEFLTWNKERLVSFVETNPLNKAAANALREIQRRETQVETLQRMGRGKATVSGRTKERQVSHGLRAELETFHRQVEPAGGVVRKEAVEDIAAAPSPAARAAEEAPPAPGRTPRVRRTPPPQQGAPGAAPGEAAGVAAPPTPAAGPPKQRVPGGPRAVPLEPRITPPVEPRPLLTLGAEGPRLPSGRVPGGPETAGGIPPPRDPYEQLVAALEPEGEPLMSKLRSEIPQQMYDRNYPLKALEEATGIAARKWAQVVPGAMGAGEDIIRRFYVPALKGVPERDWKYLEQFLTLARNDDILARNPHASLPGGINGFGANDRARQTLARRIGSKRFAAVEQAAKNLYRLNSEQILDEYVKEGIISTEQRLAMLTTHPHYVPFQRFDFTELITQSFSAKPEANLSSTGIKAMNLEGSERALSHPLQRLLQEPIKAKTVIFRNRAAKSIVRALEELQRRTGEELVRYIDPKLEMRTVTRVTGENIPRLRKGEISQAWDTISFFENGVKNRVEVPAIYGRVAKGLEAEPDNILLAVARVANAPLRYGATTFNPFFMPVNILRDASSAMFREKLFPFGPDYMAGLWAAIRKNADFSEASQAGALLSGVVENMNPRRALGNPLGSIRIHNPWDAIAAPFRLIEQANIIAERGVRIATFRKLRTEGVEVLEAAVRSRDATVDFAKSGHAMRVINQVIPFSNAGLQGSANLIRTIRDHPARSAAFAALFTTGAIMARVNNMRYETSEMIPDYEYTRNYVIQFGEGTRKDGSKYPIYVKVPKGEIAAMLTFPAEALMHLARKSEDRSVVELLFSQGVEAGKTVSPIELGGVTGFLPPVLETGVGVQTGIDPFTGNPIVPRGEEGLPPEQQFGARTSTTAVEIGKLFKISPRLVDFALNDIAAGTGQTINWLASMGLEALGLKPAVFGAEAAEAEAPPEGMEALTQVPGASRFLGTRGTQLERRGWEKFDQSVLSTNRAFNDIEGMNALGVRFGTVGSSINKVELTPDQRAQYQTLAGREALAAVNALLDTDVFRRANNEDQEAMVRDAKDGAWKRARAIMQRDVLAPAAPQPSAPGRLRRSRGGLRRGHLGGTNRLRRGRLVTPTPEPVGAR